DLKVFSNRMIVEEGPLFDEVRRKIGLNLGISPDRFTVGFLLPVKTANYLAWKELAVCRKAGFDPSLVEAVLCRFIRADGGKWNLFIEELRLKDGRRIPCGEAENHTGK